MGEPDVIRGFERARVYQDGPRRELQAVFDRHFSDRTLERVLDVGAGFTLPLDIPRSAHLVAFDSDAAALAMNENADEKVLGDIRDLEGAGLGMFDAVICWWVLEHLKEPAEAIRTFSSVLRSGGLLVLGVPYAWGLKGLATRATPYGFHEYMFRRKDPNSGKAGYGPYPTVYSRDIAPARLDEVSARFQLRPVHRRLFNAHPEAMLPGPLPAVWKGAGTLLRVATAGRWNALMSDYIVAYARE